jgi:hypothetical protein
MWGPCLVENNCTTQYHVYDWGDSATCPMCSNSIDSVNQLHDFHYDELYIRRKCVSHCSETMPTCNECIVFVVCILVVNYHIAALLNINANLAATLSNCFAFYCTPHALHFLSHEVDVILVWCVLPSRCPALHRH